MDVQAILAEVDRDGDGHIDYDEFVAMMMKVRGCKLRHAFAGSPSAPQLHAEMIPSPALSHSALAYMSSATDHEHVDPPHRLILHARLPVSKQATAVRHLLFATHTLPFIDTSPPCQCCRKARADAADYWESTHDASLSGRQVSSPAQQQLMRWMSLQGNEDVLHSKSTMRRGPHLKSTVLV